MKGKKRKGGEKKKETEKKVGKKRAPSGNRTRDLLIRSRHYRAELATASGFDCKLHVRTYYISQISILMT